MKRRSQTCGGRKGDCLTDEESYNYLTQSVGKRSVPELEHHLSNCTVCRKEISVLQEMLHPPNGDTIDLPEPSPQEIKETLNLIFRISHREKKEIIGNRLWIPSLGIAAAALVVGLVSITINHFNKAKAQSFLAQGQSKLGQIYGSQSPSGLRLDLPFTSHAQQRGATDADTLKDAEILFHQALAMKEGLRKAHLGLGYIYLSNAQLPKAREEFGKVLDSDGGDLQARLGRGACEFEEGLASNNLADRTILLEAGLADFDHVRRQSPGSSEAHYDQILSLYELGHLEEAVQEMNAYLARDSQSIWAQRLKIFQARIQIKSSTSK